jgi:glutamyl-tRNA(Gln) amidotransferase subunit E
VSDIGHDRIYLTDRLGMPLIEVVTAPEMHTPYEAYIAAQSIRSLTRSTGKVRTGIGAGREDVNVSITGGRRVEIKGVPQITRIPYLVHNEALRQRALLDIREELLRRGYEQSAIAATAMPVTDLLRQTGYVPVRNAVMNGDDVVAVRCDGFAGLLKKETQPGRPFVKEFSDRVRVVACLDTLPNIACSDFAGSELRAEEWREIMKAANAKKDDAVIIVWGTGKDLQTAVEELEGRAREAFDGVPNETRQALRDNTNGFERILPGPDRMYPDTDLPPRKITEEHLERVKRVTGMSAVRWEDMRKKYSLASHLGTELYRNKYSEVFLDIVEASAVHAPFVASMLIDKILSRAKRGLPVPGDEEIRRVFADLGRGKCTKDAVKLWADGKQSAAAATAPAGQSPSQADIKTQARNILAQSGLRSRDPRALADFCIGALKKRFNRVLDGAAVANLLEEIEPQMTPFRKEK